MITVIIQHCVAFFYLLTGSISDIRTREVSDWANYGLIAIGFASNLIFSLVLNDYSYIVSSLIGFGAFWLLALFMFYTGQWGGGDAKMLMGLGALYGGGLQWTDWSFLVSFLVYTLIAGAFYGIVWSVVAAVLKRKAFAKEFKKIAKEKTVILAKKIMLGVIMVFFLVILFVEDISVKVMAASFIFVLYFTFYLWIFIKAVEKACMFKLVEPSKLTEGDWIAKEIKVKGKYITGPKDLGIEKKQIAQLKKLYKEKKVGKILIKEGIPFVPSFLLGWIAAVWLGDVLMLFA